MRAGIPWDSRCSRSCGYSVAGAKRWRDDDRYHGCGAVDPINRISKSCVPRFTPDSCDEKGCVYTRKPRSDLVKRNSFGSVAERKTVAMRRSWRLLKQTHNNCLLLLRAVVAHIFVSKSIPQTSNSTTSSHIRSPVCFPCEQNEHVPVGGSTCVTCY